MPFPRSDAYHAVEWAVLRSPDNYAFIDGTNLFLSAKALGIQLDYHRLRIYLRENLCVGVAYYFVGYVEENTGLYATLERAGFRMVYKSVSRALDGRVNGNCDAELVLQAMIDYPKYRQAVVVSSDGDFGCLVRYLSENGKLRQVLACSRQGCSHHLRVAAGSKVAYLEEIRHLIEAGTTVEGKPHRDGTLWHSPSS